MKKVTIQFDRLVVENSPGAWLMEFDGKGHWIPKADSTIYDTGNMVETPMWLVVQKGLEAYIVED